MNIESGRDDGEKLSNPYDEVVQKFAEVRESLRRPGSDMNESDLIAHANNTEYLALARYDNEYCEMVLSRSYLHAVDGQIRPVTVYMEVAMQYSVEPVIVAFPYQMWPNGVVRGIAKRYERQPHDEDKLGLWITIHAAQSKRHENLPDERTMEDIFSESIRRSRVLPINRSVLLSKLLNN